MFKQVKMIEIEGKMNKVRPKFEHYKKKSEEAEEVYNKKIKELELLLRNDKFWFWKFLEKISLEEEARSAYCKWKKNERLALELYIQYNELAKEYEKIASK